MDSLETLFTYDSAFVFGLGGSGDIVGSIPTARLLEQHGLDVVLGGIAWEPVPKDTRPGPRSFEEIDNIELVSETVALVSGETRTQDGLEFAETAVARHSDDQVALIDIADGIDAMRRGIDAAAEQLDIDLVVGVDAGGDVLASGDEPGLRSPVTDGIGLVVLEELETDACLGVFGYGSDGELTLAELEDRFAAIAKRDGILGAWGLTPHVRGELETLFNYVETEASRIPVEAARGTFQQRLIRGEEVSVRLTPTSPLTFYFDPTIVSETSQIASRVKEGDGLTDVVAILENMGLQTELETERQRLDEM